MPSGLGSASTHPPWEETGLALAPPQLCAALQGGRGHASEKARLRGHRGHRHSPAGSSPVKDLQLNWRREPPPILEARILFQSLHKMPACLFFFLICPFVALSIFKGITTLLFFETKLKT